jgi:hypothetical protein
VTRAPLECQSVGHLSPTIPDLKYEAGASETCLIEADSRCCTRSRFGLTWALIFAANGQRLKHKFPSTTKTPLFAHAANSDHGSEYDCYTQRSMFTTSSEALEHSPSGWIWDTGRYGVQVTFKVQALKNESIQGQCAHLGGPHQVNSMLTRTNQRIFYTFVRINLSHIPPRTTQRRIC